MTTTNPSNSATPNITIHNTNERRHTLITINIAAQAPLKLTANNYVSWKLQFHSLFIGYDLLGYIDGSKPSPPTHITQNDTTIPNPEYIVWYCQDQLILSALIGSLSPTIIPFIARAKTSQEAWTILANTYAKLTRGRIKQLKSHLKNPTKGSQSITEFLQTVKTHADELAILGAPMDDDDLTEKILDGLGDDYKELVRAVQAHDDPISFEELRDKLLNFEASIQGCEEVFGSISLPGGTFALENPPLFSDDNSNRTQEISQIGEQNVVKETVALDLDKSSNKKQKKLRSDVWDNFEKHTDENGKEWAICNICKVKKDGSSKQGTTHLRNHFKSCSKNKSNEGGGSASGDKPAENSVGGGYNDSMPSRFPMQPQNVNVNAPTLLVSASQLVHCPRSNLLALGPSQSSSLGFQSLGTSNPNNAFIVKDHRGELYKKHYPPAVNDEVWRLEKIGKDGSFHKRLNSAGIYFVEDFLRLVFRDSQKLQNILGSGMSNKMWDILVEHAMTCVLSGKLYVYYRDDAGNSGVIFNNNYELSGLIANGQYYSADSLSDSEKVHVDTLVKKAYDNWMHVKEYDSKSLLDFIQNKSIVSPQADIPTGPQNYSNSFDQQVTLPTLTVPPPPEQPSMDLGLSVGGYNDSMPSRFPMHPQNVHVNAPIQFDGTSYPLQTPLVSAPQQVHLPRSDNLLAPGPSQSSSLGFQSLGTSNPNTYRGVEDLFSSEDGICMRMRRHLNMEYHSSGLGSFNATEDGYPYSSPFMSNPSRNYSFDEVPPHSSGKAVVEWLKLKAALRWGIFARKRAAERRAQLVKIEDE